jgi:hypothetical protein
MLIRDRPDELGEPGDVSVTDALGPMAGESRGLPRRLWEWPARELLHLLRGGRAEVQSPEAAELLSDLRAALAEVEIPERARWCMEEPPDLPDSGGQLPASQVRASGPVSK